MSIPLLLLALASGLWTADAYSPAPCRTYTTRRIHSRSLPFRSRQQQQPPLCATAIGTSTTESAKQQAGGVATGTSRFHVHFGAGRLGLGLVLPTIEASRTPYTIIQRPNDRWATITAAGNEKLDIIVNDEVVAPDVQILHAPPTEGEVYDRSLFLCPEESSQLEMCMQATSFSCSLGPGVLKVIMPLLSNFPASESPPLLFACENDHDMVAELKSVLQGRVTVVDCMVDRICTGRRILVNSVQVTTESYEGSIVAQDPDAMATIAIPPPFAGSRFVNPKTAQEAEYFSYRKFLMVNGMHTVLAFITLTDADCGENYENLDHSLLTLETASADRQITMRLFSIARCLMLVEKYGANWLMQVHGLDNLEDLWVYLLDFAQRNLQRFSGTKDTTSRVLGGGVSNRWSTRLWPVHKFMQTHASKMSNFEEFETNIRGSQEQLSPEGAQLLLYAGVTESNLRSEVQDLVERSQKFCTMEITNTIANLVVEDELEVKGRYVKDKYGQKVMIGDKVCGLKVDLDDPSPEQVYDPKVISKLKPLKVFDIVTIANQTYCDVRGEDDEVWVGKRLCLMQPSDMELVAFDKDNWYGYG